MAGLSAPGPASLPGGPVRAEYILSLNPVYRISSGAAGRPCLRAGESERTFGDITPGVRIALETLQAGGATEAQLSGIVLDEDGDDALPLWYYHLESLKELGAICFSVGREDGVLATLALMVPAHRVDLERPIDPDTRFVLSRFVYARRIDRALCLESPRSVARIELRDAEAVKLLCTLASGCTLHELTAATPTAAPESVAALLALLQAADMLSTVDAREPCGEDEDALLAHWSFADLVFHSRSRAGRHDYPLGATAPYREETAPLPAVKSPMSDHVVELAVPELEALYRDDSSFTRVLESRRSINTYDNDRPITVEQLGEFLYRCARVKDEIDPDGESILYEITRRPYPGGGACYELELYVVVGNCRGLESGLYHYDPLRHLLEVLEGGEEYVDPLLDDTRMVPIAGPRQVLVVLTARFERVNWKYQSIAYSVVLKDVGVLLQTMYLVATSMGLAPCAVGSGNAARFAEAIGTEYYVETSVGEFMLGSLPLADVEESSA